MSDRKIIFMLYALGVNVSMSVFMAVFCWRAMLNNQEGEITLIFNHFNEGWLEAVVLPLVAIMGIISVIILCLELTKEERVSSKSKEEASSTSKYEHITH